MTILVTGATGSVGRNVVEQLLAAGETVRAMTRKPGKAALPDGVEVCAGDLSQPETFDSALRGVQRLYLFPFPDTATEFLAAARRAGAQRVVVLSSSSVIGANEDDLNARMHRTVEVAAERSGLAWTHIRSDAFALNVSDWAYGIKAEGVVRAPYPDAAQPLIHEFDVAAVATAALLQDGHAGQAYELTGPQTITQADQVRAIGAAIGRTIRFEHQTPQQARAALCEFLPASDVDTFLGYLAMAAASPKPALPTVEQVTGRAPRTFARWAADHAEDFQ